MRYAETARQKASALAESGRAVILAIETSCDETAAAVVADGRRVLSSEIASQIDLHKLYGGVVPEIASREHVIALNPIVELALKNAGMAMEDLDAVAVTCGPGLVGALLTGVAWAKAFAYGLEKPLIAVNHIEGHVCANYLAAPDLEPPFICLVASGGHSHIALARAYGAYEILGGTCDDAAGEAFDKVGRVLGLSYPGGATLDALAESGDENAYAFPRPRVEHRYGYSFSGLKTAAINLINQQAQKGQPVNTADFAASFRRAIVNALLDKALPAARDHKIDKLALAGGVAANRLLRREATRMAGESNIKTYMPPIELCTDNATMIGSAAYYRLMKGETAGLDLNAEAGLEI